MLTQEDRKESLEHGCQYFTFKSCLDLSEPVIVTPYYCSNGFMDYEKYSQDLSSFMLWWTKFVFRDLNGFSGFSSVKFQFNGFKLK
jgi:hypothetical protein